MAQGDGAGLEEEVSARRREAAVGLRRLSAAPPGPALAAPRTETYLIV